MLPCVRCGSPVLPRSSCPACGGAAASSSAAVALLGLIVGSPLVACQELYGVAPTGDWAPPELLVTPPSVRFGEVAVGEVETRELEAHNGGDGVLELTAVDVVEPRAGFEVVAPLLPAVLKPGEQLSLEVAFAPEGVGELSTALALSSTDPDTPEARVDLSGRGVP